MVSDKKYADDNYIQNLLNRAADIVKVIKYERNPQNRAFSDNTNSVK